MDAIMAGGAPVLQNLCELIGTDNYTDDAASAAVRTKYSLCR